VVDAPRVTALFHAIRTEVEHLRRAAVRDDDELRSDPDALPAMKYRLVVCIEAATDAADHVIAAEGFRPATSFADSFRSLAEAGWLDADLAARLEDAARFRNLLVHRYADIDDDRVIEIARTRLGDLDAYIQTLASRLA
jgi:uncharacterized protein YutE (UPF0331/DUF86 family)